MMELNRLYNEDCLETMARMPDNYVDLIIADPPYGIGERFKGGDSGQLSNFNSIVERGWDKTPSDELIHEIFRVSKNQIIWGGNYFNLPTNRCFLIWDKMIGEEFSLSMAEYAWTSFDYRALMFRAQSPRTRIHPTQKPVALFRWILQKFCDPDWVVYDPFMGSGTTAVACIQEGRQWVGSELDADYCAAANKRIKQELKQPSLFEPEEINQPIQGDLFDE